MFRPREFMLCILCVALFATLGNIPRWQLVVRAKAAEKATSDVPKDSSLISTTEEKVSFDKKADLLTQNLSKTSLRPPSAVHIGLERLKQHADNIGLDLSSIHVPKEVEEEKNRIGELYVNQVPVNLLAEEVLNWFNNYPSMPKNPSHVSNNEDEGFSASVSTDENAAPLAQNSSETSSSPPSHAHTGATRLEQFADGLGLDLSSIQTPKEHEDKMTRRAEQYIDKLSGTFLTKEMLSWFKDDTLAPNGFNSASIKEGQDLSASVSSDENAALPAQNLPESPSSPPSHAHVELERLTQLADSVGLDVSSIQMPKEIQEEISHIGAHYVNQVPVKLLTKEILLWFNNYLSALKNPSLVSTNEEEDFFTSGSSGEKAGSFPRNLSEPSSSPTSDAHVGLDRLKQLADQLEHEVPSLNTPKEIEEEMPRIAEHYVNEAPVEPLIKELLNWFSYTPTPTQVQPSDQNPLNQDDQPAAGKELSPEDADAATAVTSDIETVALEQPVSTTSSGLDLGKEDAPLSDAELFRETKQPESQTASSITLPSKTETDFTGGNPAVDKQSPVADTMHASKNAMKKEDGSAQIQRIRASLKLKNPLLSIEAPSPPRAFTNRDASDPATPFPQAAHPVSSLESKSQAEAKVSVTDKVSQFKSSETVSRAVEDSKLVPSGLADPEAEPQIVTRSSEHSTIGGLHPQTAGLLLLSQFSKAALQRLDPVSRQKLAAYLGSLPVEQQQNLLYYNALLHFIPEADATKLKQLMEHVHKLRNPQESLSTFAVNTHPIEDTHSVVSLQPTVSLTQTPRPILPYGAVSIDYHPLTGSSTASSTFSSATSKTHFPESSSSSSTNTSSNSGSAGTSTSNSSSNYNSIHTSQTSSSSSSSNSNSVYTTPFNSSSFSGAYANPSSSTSTNYSSVYSRPINSTSSGFKGTSTGPHTSRIDTFPTSSTSSNSTLSMSSNTLTSANTNNMGNIVTASVSKTGTDAFSNEVFNSDRPRHPHLGKPVVSSYIQSNYGPGSPSSVPPGSQGLPGFHADVKTARTPPTATLPSSSSSGTYMLPPVTTSAGAFDPSRVPPVGGLPRIGDSFGYSSQTQEGFPQQPQQQQQTFPPPQLQQKALAPSSEQHVPEILLQQQRYAAHAPQQQHYVHFSQLPQQTLSYLTEQQQQLLQPPQHPQHLGPPQQQQYPLPQQQQQQQLSTSWSSSSNPATLVQQQQAPVQRPSSQIKYLSQGEQPYNHLSLPTTMQPSNSFPSTLKTEPQQQMRPPGETSFLSSEKYGASEDIRGAAGSQPFQLPQPPLADLGDLSLRNTLPLLEPITTLPVIQPLLAPLQQLFGTAPPPGSDTFRSASVPESNRNNSSSLLNVESSSSLSTTPSGVLPREAAEALLRPLAEVIRLATNGVVVPTVMHANELLREAHDFNARVHQGSLQATQLFNELSAYRAANPEDPLVKLLTTLEETAASISSNKDESAASTATQERISRQLQHSLSRGIRTKESNNATEEISGPNKEEGGKKRNNGGGHLRRRNPTNNHHREEIEDLLLQGIQPKPVKDAMTQTTPVGDVGYNAAEGASPLVTETAARIEAPAGQESLLLGNASVNRLTSENTDSHSSSRSNDALVMDGTASSNSNNAVVGEVKYNLTSKDDPFDFSSFASSAAAKKKNSEILPTDIMTEQQEKKSQQHENIAGMVSNVIGATMDVALDLLARQQQRQALHGQ